MRLLAVFTFTTPVGIVVGTAISSALDGRREMYFDGTFTALAAGTFIYIASLDIIQGEFVHGKERWPKWLLLSAAFGATAALALLV